MGAAIEFNEAWMQDKKAPQSGVLFVQPSNGVAADEWDAFDSEREYVNTYTTAQLVEMQDRHKTTTVIHRFSGHPWSASGRVRVGRPEQPAKRRTASWDRKPSRNARKAANAAKRAARRVAA